MTEKVKQAYSRLTIRWKISIIISVVAIFLTTFMFMAVASGISFTGQTPAGGTTTDNATPVISLQALAEEGTITAEDVTMSLNGGAVSPDLSFSSGSYTISYVPTEHLMNGTQSVSVNVYNSLTEWSFTVDAAPNPSNWYPAKDSTVNVSDPTVSVYVIDTFDNLDPNSLAVKLNGQPVTASLEFKGVYDTCTDTWIVESYKEGKISFNTSGLPEGKNTVEVSIGDSKGNVLNEKWSFYVDALPVPGNWNPAKDSTILTASPTISLYVKSKSADLDSQSVSAKLNGQPVTASFLYKGYVDTCTDNYVIQSYKEGTIKYNPSALQDGLNTVEMSIADKAGNKLIETWSFTVTEAPKITNLWPINGSENVGVTKVSAVIKDNTRVNWENVKLYINNSVVDYTYDASTGVLTYNYAFPTNNYQAKIVAADMKGNQSAASWSFISDSTPPHLTELLGFSGGMTITNGMLNFSAQLNDVVDIKNNATLKLNGNLLDFDFRYKGYEDSCTGQYIIVSKKEAYVAYENVIKDGENQTLELFAEDKFGFSRKWTWTFDVLTPPKLYGNPPNTYYIADLTPTLSAPAYDNDHIASFVMTLNGVVVDAVYDAAAGRITYTPAEPLPNETNYTVNLTVYDGIGLSASTGWKFRLNTYPDMYDGNESSCTACHQSQSIRVSYEAFHPEYLFAFEDHWNNCEVCHYDIRDRYSNIADICEDCHSGPGSPYYTDPWPYHKQTPDTQYTIKKPTEPLRIAANREPWDCVLCHQPGAGTASGVWYPVALKHHDIPQLHVAPLTEDIESCTECHARSLTREHARSGRVDQNGNAINCNTCHMSTDSAVKAAITEKNKSCAACHGVADHESLHVGDLDSNCQTCHVSALTQEHLYNPVTNPDKNYSCDTCHNSTAATNVKRTIAANNLNCAGCHTQGHNILFVDKVPADIPLYSGFDWTTPMEASIFAGDAAFPAGYEAGQVVVSNRRGDVTVEELWTFYNEQLTANGWVIKSGAPQSGETNVSAEFEKQTRYIALRLFNTATSDGTGSSTYGYRVEIWYK